MRDNVILESILALSKDVSAAVELSCADNVAIKALLSLVTTPPRWRLAIPYRIWRGEDGQYYAAWLHIPFGTRRPTMVDFNARFAAFEQERNQAAKAQAEAVMDKARSLVRP